MIDHNTAFGRVLRELRAKKELSQYTLASASGVDRSYISLIERGERSPTLDTVFRLCVALGVEFPDIAAAVDRHMHPHRKRH